MSSMRWKLAIATLSIALSAGSPVMAQTSSSGSAKVKINQVNTFEVSEGDAGTMIRIKGSSVPTFSVFKLADPPRLFIDLSHSTLATGDGEMRAVGNGVISQVALIGVNDSGQDMTRVIVGFEQAAHYDVRAEGNDVLVFIDGKARRAPSLDDKVVEARVSAAAQAALDEERARYERDLNATRTRLKDTEGELERLRVQAKSASGESRRQLDAKIAAKNAEVEQARQERSDAQKKLARAEAERTDAVGRAQRAEELALTSSREQATTLKMLEVSKQREAELAKETSSLKQREAELARETSSLKQRETLAVKKAASLEARAGQLEQELAALRTKSSKSNTKSSADASELARLEREKKANAEALTKAQTARETAQREREQSQLELARLNKEREQMAATLTSTRQELDSATARAGTLEKNLRAQREEMSAMQAQLAELKSERKTLKKKNADLSSNETEARQLEARLARAEQALKDAREARAMTPALPVAQALPAAPARPAAQALPVDMLAPNLVKDIRLETSNGRSRIVVELDRPGTFETLPGRESRAVMILNNTELPDALERTLASDAQGGAVRFVSSFIDNGQVRMEAELDSEVAETVRAEGNTLVWEFAPALASRSETRGELPAEAEPKAPVIGDSFTSAPPMIVTDPTKVSRVPGMSRKRLTIDLRNADIQNVLRLISREGGVNIIAGDDVTGSVTMRLRGVPLEEAFLTILQSQGLGFEKRSNVIRVTTQKKLLEEQTARAAARQALIDSQPLEVFLLPINYATAGDLTAQIQGILSTRGSVSVDERTNTLIIKDIADNLEPIRVLIESLDMQVPQVLIEARIVETNDTFQRQIGIQWGGDFGVGGARGNPTGLIFPSSLGLAGGATDGQTPNAGVNTGTPNYAVNLPAPVGTGSGGGIGLSMGSVGGNVNLNLRLTALEQAGHARIVSAPKILTLDNNEASISQGTSIPISVVGAAGVQTVFVQAVLELVVTPHVTPDGNIQLSIRASKNEPDFQNTGARGDPTIIRRNAETELLIKDGDTTVIGGIYTRNSGDSISAVPFLHKIPILGFFFRSHSESERRSELLIFITPRIVNRAESLGVISAGSVQAGSGGGGNAGGGAARGGGAAGGGGGGVVVQPF